ncbi:hypothetical protein [Bacillus paramycoides]|uniref:hypothetical protein n=1 Tax=Bacillus paramycoides TaxID=2026194 RepID=UPI003D04EC8B
MAYQSLPDTKYFHIQYDDSLTNGQSLAKSFSNYCDSDFEYMRDTWFNGLSLLFSTKITLYITFPKDPNAACTIIQARSNCWKGPFVWFAVDNSMSVNDIRYAFILEVSEMFMMSQKDKGWYGGNVQGVSNGTEGTVGEGLSIFLAQQFGQTKLGFPGDASWVNKWMTSTRPVEDVTIDFVNETAPPSTPFMYAGFYLLFLYYLKDQLGFSINQIIANGPPISEPSAGRIAAVYYNLTNENNYPCTIDPFSDFKKLIDNAFPKTNQLPTNVYSPFPLPYPGWILIGGPDNGPAKDVIIYKDPVGSYVTATNSDTGEIWFWNGSHDPNPWVKIGEPGSMFAATSNILFGLTPDKKAVMRWGSGQFWEQIGGPAEAIFTDCNNLYATNPDTGDLWKWNGTPNSWTKIGGPGTMWEGTSSDLFGLSTDKKGVFRWSGTPGDWEQIGGPAEAIFTDCNNLYATNPDPDVGGIYMWNGTPNSWTKIGGPGSMFATASGGYTKIANKLFGLTPDKQAVFEWTGLPGKWKKVHGPADAIFAGGQSICAVDPNNHALLFSDTLDLI